MKILNKEFDYQEMDWYQKAVNNLGIPFIFGPNDQPYLHLNDDSTFTESTYTFSLVRKINNRIDISLNRKDFGVLLIDFNIDDLEKMFAEINDEGKQDIYIINEQNVIVYNRDSNIIGEKLEVPQNGNEYKGWINHQGEKLFINQYYSDKTKWRLVTFDHVDEIEKNTLYFRNLIMMVGLICIFIAFLLAILIARLITEPLLSLERTMKQAENADFQQILQIPVKNVDEIGSLTKSFNKMTKQIQKLINDVYKSQIAQKEAQIKVLHLQINPHFLYNTLDSMSAIATLEGTPILSRMSKMLAGMFRYSISDENQMVPLQEELEQVIRYLEIQKIQYDDKFELILRIDEELKQYLVPKLLIQPIVENAIFHGLELVEEGGQILIEGEIKEDMVRILIQDNGIGIPEAKLKSIQASLSVNKSGDQIGLVNVMERIQLIYGLDYHIEIASEEGKGTTVIYHLPYKEDD